MADILKDGQLFTDDDGSQMVFFMRPCNERQELRPVIEVSFSHKMAKMQSAAASCGEKIIVYPAQGETDPRQFDLR